MIFFKRISDKDLAQLSRRLATSLESGLDIRRIFERETEARRSGALHARLAQISAAVNRGSSLTDCLKETGRYFPRLFRELIEVGEQTGKLAEVCKHLAEHYEHQVKLQRTFLAAIAWPMLQLSVAIAIVGLLIWVMGVLPAFAGHPEAEPTDILGFGLVGTRGLIIYLLIVGAIALAVAVLIRALRRGLAWTRPVQRLLLRAPGIGRPLEILALARLSWTMHLTSEAGMDVLRALPLCLRSTHNAHYTDHTDPIVRHVRAGGDLSEAFGGTGAFSREFLDSLEVGERSGRLPETMAILSRQYQERAQRAVATLTVLAGFAVWGMVAMLIIALIFQIASFYLGTINDALKM